MNIFKGISEIAESVECLLRYRLNTEPVDYSFYQEVIDMIEGDETLSALLEAGTHYTTAVESVTLLTLPD